MNKTKSSSLRTFLSQTSIKRRVKELASQIAQDYLETKPTKDSPVILVGLLKGCTFFMNALAQELRLILGEGRLQFEYFVVSSYDDTKPGPLRIGYRPEKSFNKADVIIVEDIADTAATLRKMQREIRNHHPRILWTCVLINKTVRRPKRMRLKLDYVGFQVEENLFLVGYGLDRNELYRELPFIGYIEG